MNQAYVLCGLTHMDMGSYFIFSDLLLTTAFEQVDLSLNRKLEWNFIAFIP